MNLAVKVNIYRVIAGFNVDVEITENPGTHQKVLIIPSSAANKPKAQLEALRLVEHKLIIEINAGHSPEIVSLDFIGGMP